MFAIIPQPKKIIRKSGVCYLSSAVTIETSHDLLCGEVVKWQELVEEKFGFRIKITQKHLPPNLQNNYCLTVSSAKPVLSCGTTPSGCLIKLKPQGYFLEIDACIQLVSSDIEGIFYGLQTLLQIAFLDKGRLVFPKVTIEDWPDISLRGLHFIPEGYRMNYLKKMIRILAQHKMNSLLMDFYGMFKFASHPLIGSQGGAMAPAQVKELVAYAKLWHVDIFPSIASFAHTPYILTHKPYQYLREAGLPFELCPSHPDSLKLIKELYQEVMPLFESEYFHVGGDENYFLGVCPRCASRVKEIGYGGVYLEYILNLHDFLTAHNKKMVMWGDMLFRFPEIIKRVPKDIIVMDWKYGAEDKYPDNIKFPSVATFQDNGLGAMVASAATASKDYTHAVLNSRNLARVGYQANTLGAYVTTWNAYREIDCLWYPILAMAEYSWATQPSAISFYQKKFVESFYGLRKCGLVANLDAASCYSAFAGTKGPFSDEKLWELNPRRAKNFLGNIKTMEEGIAKTRRTLEGIIPQAKHHKKSLEVILAGVERDDYEIKHKINLARINLLLEKVLHLDRQDNDREMQRFIAKIVKIVSDEQKILSNLIITLNKNWLFNRKYFLATNCMGDFGPGNVGVINKYRKKLSDLTKKIKLLSSPRKETWLKKIHLTKEAESLAKTSPSLPVNKDCWLKRSRNPEGYEVIIFGNRYWEVEVIPGLGGRITKAFSHILKQDTIFFRYPKGLYEKPGERYWILDLGGVFDAVYYNGEQIPYDLIVLPNLPYLPQITKNTSSRIEITLTFLNNYLKIQRTIRMDRNDPCLYVEVSAEPCNKKAVVALTSAIDFAKIGNDLDYQDNCLTRGKGRNHASTSFWALPQHHVIEPASPWVRMENAGREMGVKIEFNPKQFAPCDPLLLLKLSDYYHLIVTGQRKLLQEGEFVKLSYRIKADRLKPEG